MQAESSLLKSVINDLPERCAEVLRCNLAPLLCMELKCTGQKGLSGRDSQLICADRDRAIVSLTGRALDSAA